MAALRHTDFLPSRFNGNSIDRDLTRAHFLSFSDYLEAHELANPVDDADILNVVNIFKRTLQGQARLWIEGKVFATLDALKQAFLDRFSPGQSQYAKLKGFEAVTFTSGDSAEIHLQKITTAAQSAGYGDQQIKNKFITSLPEKCRSAVLMSAPDNADIQDLVRRTQQFLDLDSDRNVTKEVCFAVGPVAPTNLLGLEQLTEQVLKLTEEVRGRQPHRTPPPHRRARGSSYNSNYRQDNHRSTSRSHSSERRRPRLICNYCKNPNHKWRQCRKLKADMSQSKYLKNEGEDRPTNSDF